MTMTGNEMDAFEICKRGDVDAMKVYVKSGVDCNLRNDKRETLLHVAINCGSEDIIKFIVKEGMADIEARTIPEEWTPVFKCAYYGNASMVRCLIAIGANVRFNRKDGCTAGEIFDKSIKAEQMEEVRKVLRKAFKKVGISHIYAHEAARVGDIRRIKWYIEAGGNINGRGGSDLTMLHIACKEGQYNAALFLIEMGADIDAKEGKQWTPLYLASMAGQLEMVKLLIDKGADVNTRTHDSRTPLHGACRFGHSVVVAHLLDAGANVNTVDGRRNTPLHWACERGHYDIVREIIERGARVACRDENNLTALHWACMGAESHPDIINELIIQGATIDAIGKDGQTPLHIAADKGHVEVIHELIVKGADRNAVDEKGQSPLHNATLKGRYKVILELLKHGCSITILDNEGQSAGEVIGKGLPPGHVTEERKKKIDKLLRDGLPLQLPKAVESEVIRCYCTIS